MKFFINTLLLLLTFPLASAYGSFKDKNVSEHLDKISNEGIVREVYFIDSFIAQNSQSAKLAAIAAKKAKFPELKILAQRMHEELTQDNKKMAELRQKYNLSSRQSEEELPRPISTESLKEKTGTEFDLQFIKDMTVNQKKGVKISQELNPILENQKVRKLAEDSANRQTVQIRYLEQIAESMGYKMNL